MESIQIGDRLIVTVREDEIVMKKAKERIIEKCFGAWGSGISGVEYVKAIRRENEKRLKRLGL